MAIFVDAVNRVRKNKHWLELGSRNAAFDASEQRILCLFLYIRFRTAATGKYSGSELFLLLPLFYYYDKM